MKFNLEEFILQKINSNQWKENQKIPVEKDLINISQLSKMSVRKVIDKFKEREILYSTQGKGVFVSPFAKNSYFIDLEKDLKITKTIYLPSSNKIPNFFLKKLTEEYTNKNYHPFVKLFFIGDEIVSYSINWIFDENKKINIDEIYKNKINIVEYLNINKTINFNNIESISKTDKSILLADSTHIATTYSFFYLKNRDVKMLSVNRTKPKYFKSFEIKNFK